MAEEDRVTAAEVVPALSIRIDPTEECGYTVRALDETRLEFTFPNATREEVERVWSRLTMTGHLMMRIVADENRHPELVATARETAGELQRDIMEDNPGEGESPRKIGQWVQLAREKPADEFSMKLPPFKFMPRDSHLLRNAITGELITLDASLGDGDQGRKQFSEWCAENDHEAVAILVAWPLAERQNVEGKHLSIVREGLDHKGSPRIEFYLTPEGGRNMFSLTSRNRPIGREYALLGVVLDNQLVSAPRINEPIRREGVIEGRFTAAEINDWVAVLLSGQLHIPLDDEWISITEHKPQNDQ